MPTITLYTNPNSRGQIAHYMLEEVGKPYQTVWVPFGPEGTKSASYLALNPMGKLPTVVVGDQVVTEAAAICLFLANAFPDADLCATPEDRGQYYRWTLFAAGPLEHALTNKAMGWAAPDRAVSLGYGTYGDTVSALDQHLSNRPYICGDYFTAADVYVGSAVAWGLMVGTLEARPALSAYAERIRERPAFQRTKELNDAQRQRG